MIFYDMLSGEFVFIYHYLLRALDSVLFVVFTGVLAVTSGEPRCRSRLTDPTGWPNCRKAPSFSLHGRCFCIFKRFRSQHQLLRSRGRARSAYVRDTKFGAADIRFWEQNKCEQEWNVGTTARSRKRVFFAPEKKMIADWNCFFFFDGGKKTMVYNDE